MTERVFFNKLITKNLTATCSDQRFFEGYLTVEMVDRQNEITIVNELMKVLPIWMSRDAPISDTHSNRIVGKGINFQKTTITENGVSYPAIFMQGMIHKQYELDNEIWEKIQNGTYKGLSFGGATKSDRIPVTNKDGSVSYALKDLEQYEVAVCEEPAVPLALITSFNPIAKAIVAKNKGKYIQRGKDEFCIRCNSFGCYVDKAVNAATFAEKAPGQVEPFSEKTSVDNSIDIPVSDKSWQDTKIVDDSPQAEALPDKDNKKSEWADVDGLNKPQIDEKRVDKFHEKPRITAGNQKDPTGEDYEATAHNAGQPSSGMNPDGASIGGATIDNTTNKTENEAFKPNEELLGAAGKTHEPPEIKEGVKPEEKTINPGENLNTEKPIRGLRGTGGEISGQGGHSMLSGAKSIATENMEKSFTELKFKKICTEEYLKEVRKILTKYDYDMRGIINDPQTNDPRKEEGDPRQGDKVKEVKEDIKKLVGPTLAANNGENGKKGEIVGNLDPQAEGLKKEIANPVGGTRGGSYENTEQGPNQWDMRASVSSDDKNSRDVDRKRSGDMDSLNTINTAMKKMETAIKVADIKRAVTNL